MVFRGMPESIFQANSDLIFWSGRNCESFMKILTLSCLKRFMDEGNSTNGVMEKESGFKKSIKAFSPSKTFLGDFLNIDYSAICALGRTAHYYFSIFIFREK